uniref:Uncharacterized protein n=1 Tax=Anguilla anguilla TaxID=7936 RepID=A0A0E9RB50_ANGAN
MQDTLYKNQNLNLDKNP